MKILYFNDKDKVVLVSTKYNQLDNFITVHPGEYKEIDIVLKEDEGLNIKEGNDNIILITPYRKRKK